MTMRVRRHDARQVREVQATAATLERDGHDQLAEAYREEAVLLETHRAAIQALATAARRVKSGAWDGNDLADHLLAVGWEPPYTLQVEYTPETPDDEGDDDGRTE